MDRALEDAAGRLDSRERAFAHELCYGVTRLRGRIDHLLGLELHRGFAGLEVEVLEALRLGAYQILYMDSVPAYAAVSQTVELVRESVGDRPTGLVNAVLRKVERGGDGPERFPGWELAPLDHLESWGSHPRWLLERWLARWAADDVRVLVEHDNRPARLYVVPLDVSVEEARRILSSAGVGGEPVEEGIGCLRVEKGVPPGSVLAALPGSIVQDPGAHLVVRYSDVPEGTKVADLCAAPGGKALAVADRPLYTLAADRSESRLHMLRDNARRVGRRLGVVVADATRPPVREVDAVLLDAPCTGTGTLQRKPDARWRLNRTSLEKLVGLQRKMLDAAAEIVTEGGLLVYSTCSLEREENEDQVAAFLERHPTFHVEVTDAVGERYLDARGCLVVTPQATGFDGAFAARLRRAA